ncbi:MAG: hypothetical protein OXN81_10895 [Alphaproteobacteria bacterium]|nr:hypothetical protein [Alphaproteobacteria bacterium]
MSKDATAEVLFPDITIPVTDPETGAEVSVTARELRFAESLRMAATIRPFTQALAQVLDPEALETLDPLDVQSAIEDEGDAWIGLVAAVTGRPPEWIAALSSGDGAALSEAVWRTNGPFVARRVVWATARRTTRSPSPKSSARSPEPDTDGTPTSPST